MFFIEDKIMETFVTPDEFCEVFNEIWFNDDFGGNRCIKETNL